MFVVGGAVCGGARCGLRQAAGTAGGRGRKGRTCRLCLHILLSLCERDIRVCNRGISFRAVRPDAPACREAFTVAVGGRHEVSFAGFGLFPGPFCLGDDTWVKVSQGGAGSSCSGQGMSRLFLLDSTAYERLEGDRLTRVYEYRFMGDDFAGRKSSIDREASDWNRAGGWEVIRPTGNRRLRGEAREASAGRVKASCRGTRSVRAKRADMPAGARMSAVISSARAARDDGRYAVGMCERGYMAGYLAVETLAVEPPLAGDCERSLAWAASVPVSAAMEAAPGMKSAPQKVFSAR